MSKRPEVFILTGPVQSGKTTALLNWLVDKKISGILTPILEGRRVVYLIKSKQYLPLETSDTQESTISVGRYTFLQSAFDTMNQHLQDNTNADSDWLVVDEVGPLELRSEGLYPALQKILVTASPKVLLVVRESLVQSVIEKFRLEGAQIISKDELSKTF